MVIPYQQWRSYKQILGRANVNLCYSWAATTDLCYSAWAGPSYKYVFCRKVGRAKAWFGPYVAPPVVMHDTVQLFLFLMKRDTIQINN